MTPSNDEALFRLEEPSNQVGLQLSSSLFGLPSYLLKRIFYTEKQYVIREGDKLTVYGVLKYDRVTEQCSIEQPGALIGHGHTNTTLKEIMTNLQK